MARRWVELGAVLVVLLAAAWFRFYRIDAVPAGLAPDLAFNGLDARDVLAGHLPVFFPRNSGREPLFIYIQTVILGGAGFRLLSFTYAGAAVGVLGVAAAYRLWKELFGWRVGALAALLLGVSFWDLASNRAGFRVNSLLPFLCAGMYLLHRTLRSGRTATAVLSGAVLGLALYTYTAARLAPLLVLACCLCEWRLARKRLSRLAVVAGAAALVFAPEGLYFLRHPEEFFARTAGVATPDLGASVLGTLQMFGLKGDINSTWNLIGRPVFERWELGLCLLGLAVVLWKSLWRPGARWVLCWLVVMLAPAALSIDVPDSQRALAAAPAVYLLPALGVAALAGLAARAAVAAGWLYRRARPTVAAAADDLRSTLPRAVGLAAFGVLALGVAGRSGSTTYHAYFERWAHDADAYGSTDVSRLHLVQFLAGRAESRVFFADSDITGHVVRMFLPSTDQDGWQPETSAAVPLPPSLEGDSLYVSPTGSAMAATVASLPGVQAWPQPNNPLRKPDFAAFSWPLAAERALTAGLQPADQAFGTDYAIGGYTVNGSRLTVLWRPLRPAGPYDMYVHLLDAQGKVVAQSDRLVWPVRDFRKAHEGLGLPSRGYFDEGSETDDRLLTVHDLQAPPGTYTAEVGLAHRDPANPDQVAGGVGSMRIPVVLGPGSA